MRNILKITFLYILFLTACKDKNEINLSYTNASGEISKYTNLSFSFDKNIAPDSLIQRWSNTSYVKFSPKIEGDFKWISASELMFSPTGGFPPATSFTAKLTSEITELNDKYTSIGAKDISFYTPNLIIERHDLYWVLEENNEVNAYLSLYFNETVNTKDIKDAMSITKEDKDVSFSLLNTEESQVVKFKLLGIEIKDQDYQFKLTLAEGLVPTQGKNKTTEIITDDMILLSPYQVDIINVSTEHNGESGTVEITTSQQVDESNIRNYIVFEPGLQYDVRTTGNSLTIESKAFDVTSTYKLTLKKGLKGIIGGELSANFIQDIGFGDLQPSIDFESGKGKYLSSAGAKNVAIRIINVPKVMLKIYKVYESNILGADSYNYGYQEKDVIYEKEIETSQLKRIGSSSILTLNFEDILKDYDGIYYIEVRSSEDYWLRDSKYLSLSDIGLIVKEGKDKVYVFTNSIKTSESLGGVKLKLFGRNNQLIAETVTASDGSASLSLKNQNISGFNPALITAERNGDFTAINLNNTEVYTSRFSVGGYRDLPNGLQTFIYFERNLYRPGETVNFATIVRNQNFAALDNLPIKIEIINPTGKKLKTFSRTLNEEGSVDADFSTVKSDVTGAYSIHVYTSNDVLLASKNVLVEEFMPDRIKVNTTLSSEELTMDKNSLNVSILAQNLFGPPAANRNYQMEINYKKRYFYVPDFAQYNFELVNTNNYLEVDYREGKTDEQGQASEQLTINDEFANMGLLQADILTTVFDETGRPVNRKNTVEIFTQDKFYGIGETPYYLATNSEVKVPLVVVNMDKQKINASAIIQIVKHEYQTVLNKSGSYFRYESNKVEKVLVEKNIDINGTSSFSYIPKVSGQYEVRLYNPEVSGKYVSTSFYAYGYGKTYLSSFEVDNEGRVNIEMDKESYNVGDKAKLLFNTPFKGKMLVTLESKDVLKYYYVNTDKRSASLTIDITEEYLPNIYVSAVLIKPHETTEFPLTVAHGFQSLPVEDIERKMDVKITAVEKSRSKTKQKIKVKAAPNSYVSIAAVDEGILQVGGFSTPNPYDYFYQKRALQVSTYDIYPYLLPEISSTSVTGGDAAFDLSKRVNPFQNERVKLLSFWSGLVKTNSFGNAEYEIDIPQFSGSIRIMAVAHKGTAFGASEQNIQVADPLVISSTVPRFLSPGDTAYISSTFTNTTEKNTNVQASLSVTGNLGVINNNAKKVSIAANSEAQVIYKVYAKNNLGNGEITVKANAFGEQFTEKTDLSVRPAVPLVQSSKSGSIAGGKSIRLDFDKEKYLSNTLAYKLVVSKSPVTAFTENLSYLVHYPYGCSEQTISSVFPQLYYKDLAAALYKQSTVHVNQNILAAINVLKMRQLYNGGINMWQNCDCESWWVSTYATHFLLEAKKAGYQIDDNFLNSLLSYLKNRLKKKEVKTYVVGGVEKKETPREIAYSLYVLALANQADISLMNYYKSNQNLLTSDSKFLLAGAYVLAGDEIKGQAVLPNSFVTNNQMKHLGGSFSSPLRDEALALNVLLQADPQHPSIGTMANSISEQLKNNKYLSTQERVFSLLALGKLAKKANESSITAKIKSNGNVLKEYKDGVLRLTSNELEKGEITIETSGTGDLYYFWEVEGITKDGSFTEEDSNLKVRKSFYNRFGQRINKTSFNQNDLIVVKISVESGYNKKVENVVITDIIPAGFEIENSRITDVPGTDWVNDRKTPQHIDVRDDRVLIFDDVYNVNSTSQNYYYVVRAVSPGVYKMGPVGAEAMYDGAYHSYHGGGIVKVVK